jgi:cytochrome c2
MYPDRSVSTSMLRHFGAARLMITAGLVLIVISVATLASAAYTEAAPPAPGLPASPAFQAGPDGATLFKARCSGCHSIGGGQLVGPDLKDVAQRRTPAWLKSFIADPPAMIATDPTAQALEKQFGVTMPSLSLAPAEVDALVAYLGNPGTLPSASTAASAEGDPKAGRRIYRGEQVLTNRGPACIACHSVGGASRLNGGGLGPDLTHVAGRMGTAGLTASLKAIAFPTMLGPFGDHPLTPQEQADLVAFLQQANTEQPEEAGVAPGSVTVSLLVIFGLGLAGALVLFGLLLIFWPRQRQSLSGVLRSRNQPGSRKA